MSRGRNGIRLYRSMHGAILTRNKVPCMFFEPLNQCFLAFPKWAEPSHQMCILLRSVVNPPFLCRWIVYINRAGFLCAMLSEDIISPQETIFPIKGTCSERIFPEKFTELILTSILLFSLEVIHGFLSQLLYMNLMLLYTQWVLIFSASLDNFCYDAGINSSTPGNHFLAIFLLLHGLCFAMAYVALSYESDPLVHVLVQILATA
mmetsp:Transcript_19211/g.26866  ORF Transcript_19211/g.26866 Transcript_19211/m.26866 type:complete len:205 (+) Transcript_19211:1767-2381(+)